MNLDDLIIVHETGNEISVLLREGEDEAAIIWGPFYINNSIIDSRKEARRFATRIRNAIRRYFTEEKEHANKV